MQGSGLFGRGSAASEKSLVRDPEASHVEVQGGCPGNAIAAVAGVSAYVECRREKMGEANSNGCSPVKGAVNWI